MLKLLGTWAAIYVVCYLIDRIPFVQKFWTWFDSRTENRPFFRGAYVELRLGGIAFMIAFAGAAVGLAGSLGISLIESRPFENPGTPSTIAGTACGIIGVLGFCSVATGVLLGIYSIVCAHLKFAGLRKVPK